MDWNGLCKSYLHYPYPAPPVLFEAKGGEIENVHELFISYKGK